VGPVRRCQAAARARTRRAGGLDALRENAG
jgi:hypothetical protein